MNQLNRISLGISATIFTIIGIVLFINPIEHIGSFSWLISCGFFLISLSRFSRYYRLRQAGIIQQQQLFHSMVAFGFCGLLTALWLQNLADCLSCHFRNLADLPFDFKLPKSQFLLEEG